MPKKEFPSFCRNGMMKGMIHLNWVQIFTSVLPLIGVIIGGMISHLTQAKTLNKQLEREKEKEKKNIRNERFIVFNELLKIDGEIQMATIIGDFNLQDYREKVRPILYSKFHLLNEEIAFIVRAMDNLIYIADVTEEPLTRKDEKHLINLYSKIIDEIEKQLKSYRNSEML